MTRNEFESRIRTEIQRCLAIAKQHFPEHDFPFPEVEWNDRRTATTAGTANGRDWTVKFATRMLREHEDEIEETAAHETGHLVDYRISGNRWPTRRKGHRMVSDAHGASWKRIMRLFGRSTARCHTMKPVARKNVTRYQYKCKCRTYTLGPKRHKRIQNAGQIAPYSCRSCRTSLSRETFVGTVTGNKQDGFKPTTYRARNGRTTTTPTRPKMPKHGTKARKAVEIVRNLGVGIDRRHAINVISAKLNMSHSGAQTYYYNAKKILGL